MEKGYCAGPVMVWPLRKHLTGPCEMQETGLDKRSVFLAVAIEWASHDIITPRLLQFKVSCKQNSCFLLIQTNKGSVTGPAHMVNQFCSHETLYIQGVLFVRSFRLQFIVSSWSP